MPARCRLRPAPRPGMDARRRRLLAVVTMATTVVPVAPGGEVVAAAARAAAATAALRDGAETLVIDGAFRDWKGIPRVDGDRFDDIALAEGEAHLYLHFRLPDEAILQADSDAVLLLDTDGDPTTGRSAFGIGAEIEWRFGSRSGTVRVGGQSVFVRPSQIGLVTAPTVSTRRVEMALELKARVAGRRLFSGDTIAGMLTTSLALLGLEDIQDGFEYELGSWPVEEPTPLEIDRAADDLLRVMNINVEFDGLFESARHPAYRRIFQAIAPDIVGFQEIFTTPVAGAAALLDQWLPLGGGERWHSAAAGTDAGIASRYPIVGTWPITPGVDAYRVAPPDFGADVLVIVVSLKCCADLEGIRKTQIDAIQAFWRDAMTPGGAITLEDGTPMLMIGDMNLVGDAAELVALRTGRLFDASNGPDFDPDWDGTAIVDLRPRHTDQAMAYTWRRDDSSGQFAPGRLDFIFYTDSVLRAAGGFVLHTPSMPGKRRKQYGLKRKDTVKASDHLPVVIDVELR